MLYLGYIAMALMHDETPKKYVAFIQNIDLKHVGLVKTIQNHLCKKFRSLTEKTTNQQKQFGHSERKQISISWIFCTSYLLALLICSMASYRLRVALEKTCCSTHHCSHVL